MRLEKYSCRKCFAQIFAALQQLTRFYEDRFSASVTLLTAMEV